MLPRRQFFKNILFSCFYLLFRQSNVFSQNSELGQNPYEYNFDSFKTIDEKLLKYREVSILTKSLTPIENIYISFDDQIFMISKKSLYIFSLSFQLLQTLALDFYPTSITKPKSKKLLIISSRTSIYITDLKGKTILKTNSLGEKSDILSISTNDEYISVADYGNKIIWLFNYELNLINIIGKQKKHFIIPSPYFKTLFIENNNILALNPGKLKIEKYNLQGKLLFSFGESGMKSNFFSGCCNPISFLLTSKNDIITLEKGLKRIKLYTYKGIFKGYVCSFAQLKSFSNNLKIAIDKYDNIYVCDKNLKFMKKFSPI